MTVYIDSEFKCHVTAAEGLREFDVPYFDGKCDAFIRGYRYVPAGETWQRADGESFSAEMLTPWQSYDDLYRQQLEHELRLALAELADMDAALEKLGVSENA